MPTARNPQNPESASTGAGSLRAQLLLPAFLTVLAVLSSLAPKRPDLYPLHRERGAEYAMPPEVYALYENRRGPKGQGSCVWASNAMGGAHHDVRPAESLLRDSQYGPAVGDGAWPERVERVFRQRGIAAWNVEGTESIKWIEWGLKTGRHVAITYGKAHMIVAVGISPDRRTFLICDNNYPTEIRRVSRDVFVREHRAFGGGWCVVLKTEGPPPWARPSNN